MDEDHDTPGRQRGNLFVRAITISCALGAGGLVIVLSYAAWVGVHG
jgi:hypothetical protein